MIRRTTLLATVFVCLAGQSMNAFANDPETMDAKPFAPTIHGIEISAEGIAFQVLSGGCTGKHMFEAPAVDRSNGTASVTLRQLQRDYCEAFPFVYSIHYSWDEMELAPGEAFVVANQFAPVGSLKSSDSPAEPLRTKEGGELATLAGIELANGDVIFSVLVPKDAADPRALFELRFSHNSRKPGASDSATDGMATFGMGFFDEPRLALLLADGSEPAREEDARVARISYSLEKLGFVFQQDIAIENPFELAAVPAE